MTPFLTDPFEGEDTELGSRMSGNIAIICLQLLGNGRLKTANLSRSFSFAFQCWKLTVRRHVPFLAEPA